jgi:hypothetical protein
MGFSNVGKSWKSIESFRQSLAFLGALPWGDQAWRGVCIHHTSAPSLAMRPNGLTDQHIINIRDHYRDKKRWSSGPHLFIDDFRIMGMCPLTERGVHAEGFNRSYIGVEMLGDYDNESVVSGRGAVVIRRTQEVAAMLLLAMSKEVTNETLKFHRDDVKNTKKSCPGTRVDKQDFMEGVRHFMENSSIPPSERDRTPWEIEKAEAWEKARRDGIFVSSEFDDPMTCGLYAVARAREKQIDR